MGTISIGIKESKKNIKKFSKKETISLDTKVKSIKDKKDFIFLRQKA